MCSLCLSVRKTNVTDLMAISLDIILLGPLENSSYKCSFSINKSSCITGNCNTYCARLRAVRFNRGGACLKRF